MGTVAIGLLVFAALTCRYSPNWIKFCRVVAVARRELPAPKHATALDRAVLSANSARGFYVIQQVRDLSTEIDDPSHKIIRWRLLIPAVGHWLRLSDGFVLGFAHLGCAALVIALVGIGMGERAGGTWLDPTCLALVVGATAPFFTSMGWLGYYDSWLALGLLVVGFSRLRVGVVTACLLTPWIDERFVLGLPLALLVRWLRSDRDGKSALAWFKREAALPLGLAVGYAAVRLRLGGSGGSHDLGTYVREFVFGPEVSVRQRLYGAWAGLRLAWIPILVAIAGSWIAAARYRRWEGILVFAAVVLTGVAGLFSALDVSRSTVLLLPVAPLGWAIARQTGWWRRYPIAPGLAVAALVLPARHVYSTISVPVDAVWEPSRPLLTAENNIGALYTSGAELPADAAKAMRWFRMAADESFPAAVYNVGFLYENGIGVTKDPMQAANWYRRAAGSGNSDAEFRLGLMSMGAQGMPNAPADAARWFRLAAEQGHAGAQNNLGLMYAGGDGVPRDPAEAVKWFRASAAQGNADAEDNLGNAYRQGAGVPQDDAEALRWYRRAAQSGSALAQNKVGLIYANGLVGAPVNLEIAAKWFRLAIAQGNADAACNLGNMYAMGLGVPKDVVEADRWLRVSDAWGQPTAAANVRSVEQSMTREQIANANRLAEQTLGQIPTPASK